MVKKRYSHSSGFKTKIIALSLLFASVIATSEGCGLTKAEIAARAAQAAINVGAAYLIQISPQQEAMLGEQMKRQVHQEFKEYTTSPSLVSYIKSVGANVAAIASRRNELNYQFYVLDSPVINAFTIPGGSVFITTEALKYIKNEAQLAGVFAHEIGHNERKHTIDTIRRVLAAQGLAEGAISQNDPALIRLVASLTLNLILNGFSRNQERESDQTGTLLVTKLNYDPLALAGFLETLTSTYGNDPSRLVRLFQTHPGSQERVKDIKAYITKNALKVTNPVVNESTYRKYASVLPPKVDIRKTQG